MKDRRLCLVHVWRCYHTCRSRHVLPVGLGLGGLRGQMSQGEYRDIPVGWWVLPVHSLPGRCQGLAERCQGDARVWQRGTSEWR